MQYAIPATPKAVTYGHPVYSALYTLKEELASPVKRRDRAEIMICAAILYGFDTQYMIYKGLRSTGLSDDHVKRVLQERCGSTAGVHLWTYDDSSRRYKLLNRAVIQASDGMVVVNTN